MVKNNIPHDLSTAFMTTETMQKLNSVKKSDIMFKIGACLTTVGALLVLAWVGHKTDEQERATKRKLREERGL